MAFYAEEAPKLALRAIERLGEQVDLSGVTHLIVASCTGFVAPGVDQIIARQIGLPHVERTLVGFMGCYAAVSALRVGHHIVRSRPSAKALVVTVELCSLHLRKTQSLESLLAMLQFSDGAAAALISAEPRGFEMGRQFSAVVEESAGLIQWKIGDGGFEMTLSGEVPGRLQRALATDGFRAMLFDHRTDNAIDHRHMRAGKGSAEEYGDSERAGDGEGNGTGIAVRDEGIDLWAVHAGGRSILDAVESGLGLPADALSASREVLSRCGNMSSSTLMFVLASLLERKSGRKGVAIAFGPGVAAEGFHFLREG
jgi:predicted naringenin-chalcone synthase